MDAMLGVQSKKAELRLYQENYGYSDATEDASGVIKKAASGGNHSLVAMQDLTLQLLSHTYKE